MSIPLFFAISREDIQKNPDLPANIAWMSCHFSPVGPGLTDLPRHLPRGAMLILDDRIPMRGHQPELIVEQLRSAVTELACGWLLLELQREGQPLPVERIIREVPCPVGVTPGYAAGMDCAVFLPPVPPHMPLVEYLKPWAGRQLWLEVALDGADVTVTPTGSTVTPVPFPEVPVSSHQDQELCCHYTISTQKDAARFSLFRTPDDIEAQLLQAENTNITLATGLYQELSPLCCKCK